MIRSSIRSEPVIAQAIVSIFITFLGNYGVELTQDQIMGLTVVASLVLALIARTQTVAVKKIQEQLPEAQANKLLAPSPEVIPSLNKDVENKARNHEIFKDKH